MTAKEMKVTCFTCIVAALIVFAGISVIQLSRTVYNSISAGYIDAGWDIAIDDAEYSGCILSKFVFPRLKRGTKITLKNAMPQTDYVYPVLLLQAHNVAIKAFRNGECFSERDFDLYQKGRFIGSGIRAIPLGDYQTGETIEIQLFVGESGAFTRIKPPRLIPAKDMYRIFVFENIFVFACTLFLFLAGLIGMTLGLVLFVLHNPSGAVLLAVSHFALWSSVALFCQNNFMELFSKSLAFANVLCHFSLALAVLSFLALVYLQLMKTPRQKQIMKILAAAVLFAALASAVLHGFNVLHITRLVWLYRALAMAIIVFSIDASVRVIAEWPFYRCPTAYGCIVLLAFFMLDYTMYGFSYYAVGSYAEKGNVWLALGVVVLMAANITNQALYPSVVEYRTISEKFKKEALSMDLVTGTYNRGKIIEVLKGLQEKNADFAVLYISLNNLPLQNTLQGAQLHNDLLAQLARLILRVFAESARIGRIDDSKFMLVCENATEKQLRHLLFVFQGIINSENNERTNAFELSAGYAFSGEIAEASYRAILRLALDRNVLPMTAPHLSRVKNL